MRNEEYLAQIRMNSLHRKLKRWELAQRELGECTMSFGAGQTPPPMVMPAPPPAVAPLAPTTMKPPRKPLQPSFVSAALDPASGALAGAGGGGRSLIGGAPTTFGA